MSVSPDEATPILSEDVQRMANEVYKEFELFIGRYGRESIATIMPHVVSILQQLNEAQIKRKELHWENSKLLDDYTSLHTAYTTEKKNRDETQKKLDTLEYAHSEEQLENKSLVLQLEASMKNHELLKKNLKDQTSRFEEREADLRKEFQEQHVKYNELLKTHTQLLDRVKHEMGHISSPKTAVGSLNVIPDFARAPNNTFEINSFDHSSDQHVSSSSCSSRPAPDGLASQRQRIMRNILDTTPELFQETDFSFSSKPDDEEFSNSGDLPNSDDSQDLFGNKKKHESSGLGVLLIERDSEYEHVLGESLPRLKHEKVGRSSPLSSCSDAEFPVTSLAVAYDSAFTEDCPESSGDYGVTKEINNMLKENNELFESK
ncbi:mitogen-activated protein kinase 8 interacting protein 3 [Cichlidogyrus casuarinus]|uniref:Mitogen-activated protein kinase 8 interacting protein 3 n=1 Tax=Cichlidogyrus casuarinus TaxID=1844966 RepID=A0ABD2Q719_9PLAT